MGRRNGDFVSRTSAQNTKKQRPIRPTDNRTVGSDGGVRMGFISLNINIGRWNAPINEK